MVADLTDAEQQLIRAAVAGEVADYSTGESDRDDPKQGASWGADRTLRAEVVRRLCIGLEPDWRVDPKGIRLCGAKIAGDLDLDSVTIDSPLEMVRCHVVGEVILSDARTKRLCFSCSWLPTGLNADRMTVEGSVFLSDGFIAKGAVSLLGADIGGNLVCDNGIFENPEGHALFAENMTVKGDAFLRNGFSAKGAVGLEGATIGGDLDCDSGIFENPGGDALSAGRMNINGSVLLRNGFSAKGAVGLEGATIGGDLDCDSGIFENPDGHALFAENMTVKGDALLRHGFSAKGAVGLEGTTIGGDLNCDSGIFKNPEGDAFLLVSAHVIGIFVWRDLEILGKMTLAHTRVGGLSDDRKSWPDRGALDLNGFEYEEFAFEAPTSADVREDWLKRQEPFRPQPYEQAIRVLRRMGHDRDARDIAIAKQVAMRDSSLMSGMSKKWNRFLEISVAYGYEPWRALVYAMGFVVLGAGLFGAGFSFGLMSPAVARVFLDPNFVASGGTWLPPEYPRFNALLYSLDVLLPIVDLHQESRWLPNMRSGWGWALWIYMCIHILLGWILTSVFVAALTGLLKKD